MGDAPIVLLGEAADFTRVWRNLISNAIKYTPPQGQITVRLDRFRLPLPLNDSGHAVLAHFEHVRLPANLPSGDYLLGQVADTGHGIPAEDFERLFVRFQRGWASQSNIPGTGLGLALVREVLNLYGGGIDVVSAPDVGSVFSFWIPIGKVTP
jgi:signal transduction histidine kinase